MHTPRARPRARCSHGARGCSRQTADSHDENATENFSPSVSLKEANPFKGLEFQSSRYNAGAGYALPKTNGDIPLISLYKLPGELPGEPKFAGELVLVLTDKPVAPK